MCTASLYIHFQHRHDNHHLDQAQDRSGTEMSIVQLSTMLIATTVCNLTLLPRILLSFLWLIPDIWKCEGFVCPRMDDIRASSSGCSWSPMEKNVWNRQLTLPPRRHVFEHSKIMKTCWVIYSFLLTWRRKPTINSYPRETIASKSLNWLTHTFSSTSK